MRGTSTEAAKLPSAPDVPSPAVCPENRRPMPDSEGNPGPWTKTRLDGGRVAGVSTIEAVTAKFDSPPKKPSVVPTLTECPPYVASGTVSEPVKAPAALAWIVPVTVSSNETCSSTFAGALEPPKWMMVPTGPVAGVLVIGRIFALAQRTEFTKIWLAALDQVELKPKTQSY